MQRRPVKLLASVVLASVLFAASGVAAKPASAQTPPRGYSTYPIVITSGFAGIDLYLEPLRARLSAGGVYDVTIFSPPLFGVLGVNDASLALKKVVEDLRAEYNGRQVDMVTLNTGGTIARNYIKHHGGDAAIDDLVMLGAPHHGSALADLARLATFGTCIGIPVCAEFTTDSALLKSLNEGDESVGNVRYTNIATTFDELVFPHTSSFMDEADGNIVNVTVQDQCPTRLVEHLGLVLDGAVFSAIDDALGKRPIEFDCGAL